jgi:uncharacterized membrane protein YfcA
MEIIGSLAAVLIGVLLGIIGGGGSILTVPVLVYLFGIVPVTATAYSLFMVGTTSVLGSISYFKKKEMDLKTAVIFGIPSVATVYMTRAWLLPSIPHTLWTVGTVELTKDLLLMLLFAILMLLASYSMLRGSKKLQNSVDKEQRFNYPLILLEGGLVGVLTGLVGAGGGFLIIPALVLLSRLPMKKAIGTSLLIIATKSLIGFIGEIGQTSIDWSFLLYLSGLAMLGILLGIYLERFMDSEKLKPAFGVFVLLMGLYILVKEIWF